ncbi:MAG: energy transducer TonB [bacterium]
MREKNSLLVFILISFILHLGFVFFRTQVTSGRSSEVFLFEVELMDVSVPAINVSSSNKVKAQKSLFPDKAEGGENKKILNSSVSQKPLSERSFNGEASFAELIRKKIESVKLYPAHARMKNYTGEVHLRFLINTDGEVDKIKLVKSSGFDILDESAIKTVEKAAPFIPVPQILAASGVVVSLPIIFDLE